MGTIITGGVLIGVVGWIIRGMVLDKRKGKSCHSAHRRRKRLLRAH